MPGPMMARSRAPAPPMKGPSEEDIDALVEMEGQNVDKVVEMNTPTGRYTENRLKTFAASLQKCMDMVQPGVKLETQFQVDPQRPFPMPRRLVEAYLTVLSAYDAWAAENDVESGLPPALELTDDAAIARALPLLNKLHTDKSFKKWAAAQVQPTPPTPSAPSTPAAAPEIPADLAALFGG